MAAKSLTFNGYVKDELGYPFEKHVYTTQDGYINSVFRIPGPKGTENNIGKPRGEVEIKPVVIYQHGLMDSAVGIIADGEDSLGLKLVNLGYDLWMNNSRGNRYSQNHMQCDNTLFDNSQEEYEQYWNYSFQEMAEYD